MPFAAAMAARPDDSEAATSAETATIAEAVADGRDGRRLP
jgi:hypothetical protein